MAEASIPVDLFNPGQVFACLGFLEAADVLRGDAEGGFDWSDESQVRFVLRAAGDSNPFASVLEFLAKAEVRRCAPIGYTDPPQKKKARAEEDDELGAVAARELLLSEAFPGGEGDRMSLPIRLDYPGHPAIDLGHWADGSCRSQFKLYAGNRSAHRIACAMLRGTRKKPSKKRRVGELLTQGVNELWEYRRDDLSVAPFDVLTLMGGSFNFDARGSWTALDAGYSPNQHNHHGIAASPVVEFLAAWGLENARPEEYETRKIRYGAWGVLVPPILARPTVAGASVGVPLRRFQFVLALAGKNKVITFAREEVHA